MKISWLALMLFWMALPLHADVYKWIDAEGKVQYGDVPPKDVKASKVSGGVMVVPAFSAPAAPASVPAAAVSATPPANAPLAAGISAKPSSSAASSVSAREEMRLRLIEACQRNRGADCENEADAQLNGQSGTVYVPVPGWSRPPIRPTPKPHSEPSSASSSSSSSSVARAARIVPKDKN